VKLNQSNPYKAQRFVSPVISVCSELLQVEHARYPPFARLQLQTVLASCVSPTLWNGSPTDDFAQILDAMDLEEDRVAPFEKCVSQMRFLLSQRFQFQMKFSLEVLNDFLAQLDPTVFPRIEALLFELLALKSDKKTPRSLFQKCFSTMVARLGPQNVLKIAPISLQFDLDNPAFEDESNLWLIPYLNKHMKATNLSFFVEQ